MSFHQPFYPVATRQDFMHLSYQGSVHFTKQGNEIDQIASSLIKPALSLWVNRHIFILASGIFLELNVISLCYSCLWHPLISRNWDQETYFPGPVSLFLILLSHLSSRDTLGFSKESFLAYVGRGYHYNLANYCRSSGAMQSTYAICYHKRCGQPLAQKAVKKGIHGLSMATSQGMNMPSQKPEAACF